MELIWHLASLTELPLPTHSLSQKQSLLFISATGSSLVDERLPGLTSGARFLSQLTATSNFLDRGSADRPSTSGSSLSRPHQRPRVLLPRAGARAVRSELECSGRLWSCSRTLETLIFLHTQHPWKCVLLLLPSRPRAPWQKKKKKADNLLEN